ncbi:MAG: DUF368 domain-containing protein [Bacteroidetes bacterium HGW-Bacteroidetes-13]|jgi:uncharacterized membrane protein|nr:MAG: DUF368 domain-containing protein [Bacteroidetes bacterium HGW-Bacteroidetes-13]
MPKTRSATDKLFLLLKGLGMGAANKVPGVSGGVVAFVAGFYEEFIYSLQKINAKALKLLVYRKFTTFYQYINGQFLFFLILGMLVSYFSVSKILDYLIERYELYVWGTFFGMIAASVFSIAKDFKEWNYKSILGVIFGIIFGVAISLMDPAQQNDNLAFVFFCGIISVSGMTLPGLSGSFILILMGNYVLLLVDSVNALYDTLYELLGANFSFIHNAERLRLLTVLAAFTAGSAVGLVSLSHLLSYLIKHFKNITYSIITGFIAGSLGVVWPWKEKIMDTNELGIISLDSTGKQIIKNYERYWPEWNQQTIWVIAFMGLGIFIILALEWYGAKTRQERA